MAHQRLLCVALLAALVFAPAPAAAGDAGLTGDDCQIDDDCLSRKCTNGVCAATTCGLPSAQGGVYESRVTFCSNNAYTTFNGDRVCTFGFNQCTRAECCDTLSCDAGIPNASKSTLCPSGQTFAGSRLCKNGVCAASECCVVTQCDGAGGVPVTDRATFCPQGQMFDNVGICAGGQGACQQEECCTQNTRTCGVAFAQLGLSCSTFSASSVLDAYGIYDTNAGTYGGCCVTTTCSTGVLDSAKPTYCDSIAGTEFSGTEACTDGSCLPEKCCKTTEQFCVGTGLVWQDSQCKCSDSTKVYVPGTGCVCGAGKYTSGSNCVDCPHGTYSAEANAETSCTSCPTNVPYTSTTASTSVAACYNYCDQWLLDNTASACSNGGTCASLSGGAGSFSCTCPSTWMGFGESTSTNCDAPTTLLRLRALAGSGVTLPNGFTLNVGYVLKGDTPSYAAQAPTGLACAVATPSSTPTVPSCTAGDGALSVAGGADNVRNMVNAKVALSTSNPGSSYTVEWVCSDGTGSAGEATLAVVLPGPAAGNPNGQTLVCTAIVRAKASVPLIKVKLASGSAVPAAATNTRDAQLTFLQGSRPICVAAATSTTETTLDCPYSDVPFVSGQTGTLGVSNIDMEKYTVTWTCSDAPATPLTTNAFGVATSPELPAATSQTSLVCEAYFELKRAQIALTASNAATTAVRLTATQTDMSEPCVATIPAGASSAAVSLTCPNGNLKSGTSTRLMTNATLTSYMVEFTCTTKTTSDVKSRIFTDVISSTNVASDAATVCSVAITELPPLLRISITNTAGAPAFSVIGSQRAMLDACTLSAANTGASTQTCPLGQGMMPSLNTTLTPRGLDVNRYQVAWSCTGGSGFATDVITNLASVFLDVNPNNADATVAYPTVVCTGTVTARGAPVTVRMVVDASATGFVATSAQLVVRQNHQSSACSSTNPTVAVAPTCPAQALRATANTRTTLSTLNVNTSAYKVAWACVNAAGGAERTVTTISAGVARVDTLGPDSTVSCTATISGKPALLKLIAAGSGPASAWSLTARQTMQGRACTVASTVTEATAPTCEIQEFLPTRATVLATTGLDTSRYSVAWACKDSENADITLTDALSRSGVILANSKTVTLDKDPNVGGGTVVCTATVAPLTGVLRLVVSGATPANARLTAKQSTQTEACTFAVSTSAAAPTCSGVDIARGLSVELGATGLGTGYFVSGWACDNDLTVANLNDNAATVSALPATGVTTCMATIASTVAPIQLLVPTAAGLTFTAKQGNSEVCSVASAAGAPVLCTAAAASTATTLSVSGNAGDRPTFACTVGGTNVPVSRLSANSAIIMAPASGVQMTCTLTVETAQTKPIIALTSSVPTTLNVEYFNEAVSTTVPAQTCASPSLGKALSCLGTGELIGGRRVRLSQSGLTSSGYYRWMCSSSAADIQRAVGGDSKVIGDYTASATVLLPTDGSTLSCNLMIWSNKPGFIRDRRMMM
jgi:hypothetical protein